jgi:hypothetical protein
MRVKIPDGHASTYLMGIRFVGIISVNIPKP